MDDAVDTDFPIFIVTGTSGAGKTAVIPELRRLLPGVAVLDKDHMWHPNPGAAYDNFFRIAAALATTGIYTVIVGTIIPEHFTGWACEERDRVGEIRYVNLHCSDGVRERRLRARPAWRKSSTPEFIEEHRKLAARLLAGELPAGTPTFDTTKCSVEETAAEVASYIRAAMAG